MKYQVSCDMMFGSQADRDSVYSYLEGRRELAFLLPGDFMLSDDPVGGGYRVACTFRTAAMTDRDEIYVYLQGKKADIATGTSGHIEKHLCRHDEGKPCEESVIDIWGDGNA